MARRTLLPEGFPFTIAELRQAARRWLPPKHAKLVVDNIVSEGHREIERHNEQVARWQASGRDPGELRLNFYVPDEVLAYLSLISPNANERVRAFKEEGWAEVLKREIEVERRRSAERAGLIPTIDDVLDAAERRGELSWSDPRVFAGLAVTGNVIPEPPAATPEVIAAAKLRVAEDVAEWEEMVDAARNGAPMPSRPNGISDVNETMREEALPERDPNWPFIDDYIDRYDRSHRGEARRFAGIARDLPRFNAELVRALAVAPERAIPRVIMYHLLGGHNSPVSPASPVGSALTRAFGPNAPPRTTNRGEELYECADLLQWFETNRASYETYALFDEWKARTRTRREVAWMRLVRDRYDEVRPERLFEESSED